MRRSRRAIAKSRNSPPAGVTPPARTCRRWHAALPAFERRDFAATIEALAPLAGQNERIGGSRAQHDLIEFTLLKAYLGAQRLDEAKRLLSARRPGASGVAVGGGLV